MIPNYIDAEPDITAMEAIQSDQHWTLLLAQILPSMMLPSIASFAANIHLALEIIMTRSKREKTFEVLNDGPRYERFRKYFHDLKDRPTFQRATFYEVCKFALDYAMF